MANNYKYIGHNYTTPDLVAKVTGKARYAEDHRAEGMLFIKLLLSPMPHARVVSVDDSAALAHPGVKAILRASDFPVPPPPPAPPGQPAPPPPPLPAEIALTDEPVYQGEPILAIAAVDETHRGRGHRTAQRRLRAAALLRRSARQPAAGRRQRPHPGQRLHRRRPRAEGRRPASGPTGDFAEAEPKAACRWARRPTPSRSATSRPASRPPT